MFGLVSKKAYDSLALDLECERVHARQEKKSSKALRRKYEERIEMLCSENACLKIANKQLITKLDAKEKMLEEATNRIFDLQMMLSSMEARWGKEGTI